MQQRKSGTQAPKSPTPPAPQARKPAPAPAPAPRVAAAKTPARDGLAESMRRGPTSAGQQKDSPHAGAASKPATSKPAGNKPANKPTTPAAPAPAALKPRDADKAAGKAADKAPTTAKRPAKAAPPLHVSRPDSAHEQAAAQAAKPGSKPGAATSPDAKQTAEAGGPPVPPAVAALIHEERGRGRPLPPQTRKLFEARLGGNLSQVRIHDNPSAASAADQLHADAFTSGQDIFFARDRYDPDTESGKRLLAHELTHTLQAHPGKASPTVFRSVAGTPAPSTGTPSLPAATPAASAPPPLPPGYEGPLDAQQFHKATAPGSGQLNADGSIITFETIGVPGFKLATHGKWPALRRDRAFDSKKRGTAQTRKWDNDIKEDVTAINAIGKKLIARFPELGAATPTNGNQGPSGNAVFTLKTFQYRKGDKYLTGTLQELAEQLVRPHWSPRGERMSMEVDHMVEVQVAGWPTNKSVDEPEHYILLEKKTNIASGGIVKSSVSKNLESFRTKIGPPAISHNMLKAAHHLDFDKPTAATEDVDIADKHWLREQIKLGSHIELAGKALQLVKGARTNVAIPPGGQISLTTTDVVTADEKSALAPFAVSTKTLTPTVGGGTGLTGITIAAPESKVLTGKSTTLTITPEGPGRAVIPSDQTNRAVAGLSTRGVGPFTLTDMGFDVDLGFFAHGVINPSIPLLKDVLVDFALDGDELSLTLSRDLPLPPPLRVTNASLKIGANLTDGIFLEGALDFEVAGIGNGSLKAGTGKSAGFNLAGSFDFDSKVFTKAKVTVEYNDGKWSGGGALEVGANKIPGVDHAQLDVSLGEDHFSATGTAKLAIQGLNDVQLHASYAPGAGLEIGGSADLSNLTGIRSGSLDLTMHRKPTGDWSLSGAGRAQPKVTGFDTELAVRYDNGVFNAEASAAFARGSLSGNLKVGVTNAAVAAAGAAAPGDAPQKGPVRVYGGGSLTLKLAPWLQGTASVNIRDNGELEVAGKIGLPAALDMFPEKKLDRSLFKLGLDIPIVGVSVAGTRVGIFATIRAGLDAIASVGPGQLRKLELNVDYNPEHEEKTQVTGDAEFNVPARAGLRAFVSGGIGVGALVSVSGNIEFGGFAGIEGAATAAAHLDWSPTRGLVIDAKASIDAQPKFAFDITGVVLVEVGALGFDVTLYEKRWQLAKFEYGAQLAIGATIPIHYDQGKPFDISMDDVEFRRPEVDLPGMLAGLVKAIA